MSKKSDTTNKETNIDDLIGGLCEDLSPIKRLWCPYRLFALWSVVTLLYFCIVIFVIGLRHDLMEQLSNSTFIFEAIIALSFAFSAALTASWLTIPDMRGKAWFKAVPMTLFGVFVIWNGIKGVIDGIDMPHFEWTHCVSYGLFMEAFPLAFIIFLAFFGKTTRPYWMMFMNIISVAGIAWLGLRLTCPMDDMGHAFLYHFLPVTVIGGLLIAFARRIFKW